MSPEDVLALQREMGFLAREAGPLDQGTPGQYFASHAERQVALLEPDAPIEVSPLEVCDDCQAFFRALAGYRGVVQMVTDPFGIKIFKP